jgi:hypothetical protein
VNDHKVHFIYIVPADKEEIGTQAIENCAKHLQAWYKWQMNGKTFTLANPIVTVYHSTHEAAWFPNNPVDGATEKGWYWSNSLAQARDLAGVHWSQPLDSYMLYVDTLPNPGQRAGGTKARNTDSGIALLSGDDIASLMGIANRHNWTQCRAIGGSGHELGHTFGLPHPANHNPAAIMWTGYGRYPACILQDADRAILDLNSFFSPGVPVTPPPGLCPFSRLPTPRKPPRRP